MVDFAIVDFGTPHLAARCAGSLDSPFVSSIEIVDSKARSLSYAQAVNGSLCNGDAPYVCALNADTRMIADDSLKIILDLFAEDDRIGVIGPRQIDDEGRITHAAITGTNLRREQRFWMQPLDAVEDLCSERMLDVPMISGAVFFARRDCWEETGGFLASAPHFYEESWTCVLARHLGWRVVYTGATTWEHLFNRSPTTEAWRMKMMVQSREAFYAAAREHGIEVGG